MDTDKLGWDIVTQKKTGRRDKLTPETQERIVNALRNGNYIEHAVQAAGVGTTTFFNWMTRGDEEKQGRYVAFRDAVKRAQADAVLSAIEIIQSAGRDGTWQAAAWMLERTQIGFRQVNRMELDVKKLSDDELDALISGNTTSGARTP